MKTVITTLILLIIVLNSHGQPKTNMSKEDYLLKSKNQKKTAMTLLYSGLGIAALGGVVQLSHEGNRGEGFDLDFTGAIIAIAGGIVAATSIPFFINSAENSRKGISLSVHNEQLLFPHDGITYYSLIPVLSIKLRF